MHIEDGMTVQQKAGEKVAPIDFPGNFSPTGAASHPRYTRHRKLPTDRFTDYSLLFNWASGRSTAKITHGRARLSHRGASYGRGVGQACPADEGVHQRVAIIP